MTPAVLCLERAGRRFELLAYDAGSIPPHEVGQAAAHALGLPVHSVYKTLIAKLSQDELVVAVIPVAERLNLKRLARAANEKSARMADLREAERATGYLVGGISPVGQKRTLRTFLHEDARTLTTIHVSAGKRGLELALSPNDLISVTRAVVCALTG